jgi:hypothetical protein
MSIFRGLASSLAMAEVKDIGEMADEDSLVIIESPQ